MWRSTNQLIFSLWKNYNFCNSKFPKFSKFSKTAYAHYSSTSNPCPLEAAPLTSRSLIKIGGLDCLPFLQGILTNDIAHLESKPSIFTLLLNHQGRVLYDVILYQSDANDKNSIWIECDTSLKPKLLGHLKLFKIRKAVEISSEDKLSVWVVYDPGHVDNTDNIVGSVKDCCEPLEKHSAKREPLPFNPEGSLFHVGDPRLPELGWRVLINKDQDKIFPPDVKVKEGDEGYKALRYWLGVGEGAKEIPSGSSFPLEANGDFLHGVSFHKGCYIGQELTARTHHTGVVRKRLMPFRFTSPPDNKEDLEKLQILAATGRPVGKIRGIQDNIGIALFRVEEALASPELKLDPGGIGISVWKPSWWPIEASKELASRK